MPTREEKVAAVAEATGLTAETIKRQAEIAAEIANLLMEAAALSAHKHIPGDVAVLATAVLVSNLDDPLAGIAKLLVVRDTVIGTIRKIAREEPPAAPLVAMPGNGDRN